MSTGQPFLIFPWQNPFLGGLKQKIMADTDGKPGRALIIVPNERPWQYFRQLFVEEGRALILPKMITGSALAARWRLHAWGPAAPATLLDQVYYLHAILRSPQLRDSLLEHMFGQMDMAQFLPWGMRLAQLLEEMLQQHVEGENIAAAEGDVHRYAIALLGSLKQISRRWRQTLREQCLTTRGFDAFQACEHVANVPPDLLPAAGRPVYIAGFSVLNGCEKILFRALWEQGAQMCFHGDAALATGGRADAACAPIAELKKQWGAMSVLAEEPRQHQVEYACFSAYDGHSQLEALVADRAASPAGTAAIVLLNGNMLSPTLHHLEDKEINISMGYPLTRAPLCGLLHAFFTLCQNRLPGDRYYWRDIDLLLHNPLIGLLRHGDGKTFRSAALPYLRKLIRGGVEDVDLGKYVSLEDFLGAARGNIPPWCMVILRLGQLFLESLGKAQTPAQLAAILAALGACIGRKALLLPRTEDDTAGRQFPLDTEALCRLQNNVLPALGENALADEPFPLATLRDMLQALLDGERIPFKAFPLLGTQVLGMLETRLLHFQQVYILDASDDLLPGSKSQDPLLPDNLRPLLGLPQSWSRQQVVAYNLARLCAGADRVHFYWNQGMMPGSMEEGKKRRSRFVEDLIWREEQKQGKILEPGQGLLRCAQSRATVHRGSPRVMTKGETLQARVEELLNGTLSAAMLNNWLVCPAKFAYRYLLWLNVPDEVNEGEDYLAMGNCVHDILRDLYEPWVGKDLPDDEEARRKYVDDCLGKIFEAVVEKNHMESKLPVFSWLYFEKSAPRLIRASFLGQPKGIRPLRLEQKMRASITLDGWDYAFGGRIDRIDQRGENVVILDYKTGKPRENQQEFWENEAFFQILDACQSEADIQDQGDGLFEELRTLLPDVQLPIYMLMTAAGGRYKAANAAWVWLRQRGERQEEWLWPEDMTVETGLARCASVLAFLLRHLRFCKTFQPQDDSCEHCEYQQACYTVDGSGKI